MILTQQMTPKTKTIKRTESLDRSNLNKNEIKSFRHQSIDSTVGTYFFFQSLKSIRLRLLLQSFNRWKILEFLNELQVSEETSKKHLMEIKFKSRAANHRIKALENQLANIHTEKYQKEINQEFTKALSRAETAEL